VLGHLIGAAGPPTEYLELVLCRVVYHCRPSELQEIPLRTILRHVTCLSAEGEASEFKGKMRR